MAHRLTIVHPFYFGPVKEDSNVLDQGKTMTGFLHAVSCSSAGFRINMQRIFAAAHLAGTLRSRGEDVILTAVEGWAGHTIGGEVRTGSAVTMFMNHALKSRGLVPPVPLFAKNVSRCTREEAGGVRDVLHSILHWRQAGTDWRVIGVTGSASPSKGRAYQNLYRAFAGEHGRASRLKVLYPHEALLQGGRVLSMDQVHLRRASQLSQLEHCRAQLLEAGPNAAVNLLSLMYRLLIHPSADKELEVMLAHRIRPDIGRNDMSGER